MKEMTNVRLTPLKYRPIYEVLESHEASTEDGLQHTLRKISETTYKHSGHASRSVHAKSHGLIQAEIEIYKDLPDYLAQGIFAVPKKLPLAMRFSTVPGDMLDDKVSTPRGLAIKIIGVDGERLRGSEGDTTQDFLFVNGPSFVSSNAKQFLSSLKLLASTTDIAPNFKIHLSKILQKTSKLVESFGGNSAFIKSLGGHPETNLLGETYYSQAPILYGDYMAKVSLVPICPELIELTNKPVDLTNASDGLRKAVVDFFTGNTAVWELRIQLCTDIQKMPIEDSSVVWPEDISPYFPVAKITAKPQIAWSPLRSRIVDDGMRFSPWHGVKSHRPLGSVMRLRKMAYEMSSKFRAEHNGMDISEPTHLDDLC